MNILFNILASLKYFHFKIYKNMIVKALIIKHNLCNYKLMQKMNTLFFINLYHINIPLQWLKHILMYIIFWTE